MCLDDFGIKLRGPKPLLFCTVGLDRSPNSAKIEKKTLKFGNNEMLQTYNI